MVIVGKRERKYGKIRGRLCRPALNILSGSNLAYAAMCIVERKNKYKTKTISNSYLIKMMDKEVLNLRKNCFFEHIFLYMGNRKVAGANFPNKEFIYDDIDKILGFDKNGMMHYTYNNSNNTKYYLFSSKINKGRI